MKPIVLLTLFVIVTSCGDSASHSFDASGTFEADETIISAEVTGTLLEWFIEEGDELQAGTYIGYVDTTQLYLKKYQLQKQIEALLGKRPDIPVQLSALQQQLKTALQERDRLKKLVDGGAATSKQLDDMNAEIEVLKKNITAQSSSLNISSAGLTKDAIPLNIQIQQLDDQLKKSVIINPVNGVVLTRYANVNEMAVAGKPLYKIADLSEMILRVYITGDQLAQVKLHQKVQVYTDDGEGGFRAAEGEIIWISSKAEFTPKTIQTKNERANLVYAVKVKLANEGYYKIGMYGEIKF